MEVSIDVTHVGRVGENPVKLVMNDVNMDNKVNMYLDGEHYRANLNELQKLINIINLAKGQ